MEKALLGHESSGGGSSSSSRRSRDASALFRRRSEAITHGSPYQKAAALVDLYVYRCLQAEDGVGLPEQILDQSSFETAAKFYFIFTRFDILWSLNYFALIVLNFLEKPLWCDEHSAYSCNNREYYFLGQLPYLTGAESLVYEGVTLIILMIHTFFPISYEGFSIYWKSALNILKMPQVWVELDTAQFTNYVPTTGTFCTRWWELRDSMLILAGMLSTYLNILALGLLFLLFSSWIAYVMFEDTEQGKTVFTSFGTTLYQMFVLFTTSNNPDVWIPAYNLAKQVAEKDRMRNRTLGKAFNLIDKNRTLPKISREDFELIFDELDDSHDFKINLDEFADLCNAIGLRFQKEDSLPWFEKFPTIYNSSLSKKLKTFARSPMFEYIVAFVLIMNLVAVIIETTLDIENSSAQKVWQNVEFVFE
ncbi:unnamed protein product [Camellia sinensis]